MSDTPHIAYSSGQIKSLYGRDRPKSALLEQDADQDEDQDDNEDEFDDAHAIYLLPLICAASFFRLLTRP